MMVIDSHTHCYPEKVAAKALSAVQGRLEPATDGTRDGLIASMREAGIDYSLALGLVTNPANSLGVNRWAAEQNRAPVFFTGSIHPDDPDPETTLDFIADSGLKGIKLHPEYQRFEFSEERLFPLWERCCELGLFVVTHAGYDIMFQPPWHTDPERLAAFHRRFPELRLVLAHLGSMTLWDDVEKYLLGLPVYFDLAFVTPEYIEPERLVRIIRRHGAEWILFGTDSPWCSQKKQLAFIRSLPLTCEEREQIFWKNAAMLLDLPDTAPRDVPDSTAN